MPSKRIVPLRDVEEGIVEFDDGSYLVPAEYRRFLAPHQRRVEMAYQDWVHRVVDAAVEQRLFESALWSLAAPHLGH